MPIEDRSKESLQDVLKELLSAPPAEGVNPREERPGPDIEEAPSPEPASPGAPVQPGAVETDPTYEVEIIPPEPVTPPVTKNASQKDKKRRNGKDQAQAEEATMTVLEGTVHIQIVPVVTIDRVASFEQALKEIQGIRWKGTFGKARQGTTIVLQLENPITTAGLLQGPTAVEKAELAKAGKDWQIRVTLRPEGVPPGTSEPAPQIASAQPDSSGGPSVPVQQEPVPVYVEPVRHIATAGQVDLEASPIDSLDSLNRFEKLLTSTSPGCRIVNVLSLDGVSTVLITLEGTDEDTVYRKLPEKVGGVELERVQGRLIAKLPEKW